MRIAVLSDVHVAAPGRQPATWHNELHYETALERLEAGVALATARDAELLLVAGDLTDDGGDESLHRLLDGLAQARMPVWVVPGNHDALVSVDALDRAVARSGSAVRVAGPWWMPLAETIVIAGPRLRASPEQGVFAVEPPAAVAPDDRLPLWLTHYPVLPHADRFAARGLAFAEDAHEREGVDAALHELDRPVLVVSGHLHARDAMASGRVLEVSASPSIEAPFEATLLEIEFADDVRVRVERIGLGFADPDAGRLPVLVPEMQAWAYGEEWRLTD